MSIATAEKQFEPQIVLQDDGNSVCLLAHEDSVHAPVSVAWLMDQIHNSPYARAKIDPIAITYWVKAYNAGDDTVCAIVADLIDAQCEIKIDPDGMSAYLYITPAMGGADITRRDIIKTLIDSRITRGIVNRSISEALDNPDASKLLIAKGRPPKHGSDSRFEIVIDAFTARRNLDATDLHAQLEHADPVLVNRGDILVRRHPPSAGSDGEDIFGNTIPAYQGQELAFPAQLTGCCVSPEAPDTLCASIHGQVVATDEDIIQVRPMVSVEQVDLSTGHIDFDGSVHVLGNVAAGMKVLSSGDIIVNGRVEAGAVLEAQGNIVVKRGVYGQDPNDTTGAATGATQLRSRANIYARAIHHAHLHAGKCLLAEQVVANCEADVGEHVIAGPASATHASIYGGTIKARYSIQADELGSSDAILTRLQVGETQNISTQIKLLVSEIEETHNKRCELERDLAQQITAQARNGAEKARRLSALNQLNKEILELTNLLMLLYCEREKCETEIHKLQQACITGRKQIHPNLRIKIANHSQTNRSRQPSGSVLLSSNSIEFTAR